MKIMWQKSNQHYPPTMMRLDVGATIDTEKPGISESIPDNAVNSWIAEGFASQVVEPPVVKYRINQDDCVECAACIEVCAVEAITPDPYSIDEDVCNGCAECLATCPVEAIEPIEE